MLYLSGFTCRVVTWEKERLFAYEMFNDIVKSNSIIKKFKSSR